MLINSNFLKTILYCTSDNVPMQAETLFVIFACGLVALFIDLGALPRHTVLPTCACPSTFSSPQWLHSSVLMPPFDLLIET